MVKVIEKGNRKIECQCCKSILAFEESDILYAECKNILSSLYTGKFRIRYIMCPECHTKIIVNNIW